MATDPPKPRTRDQVIQGLALATASGSLGLFVGSGVTLALTKGTAKTGKQWQGLLEQVAALIGVSYPDDKTAAGKGYPLIASLLIDALAATAMKDETGADVAPENRGTRAVTIFKQTTASENRFVVHPVNGKAAANALREMRPAWAITTNYDTCMEQVLDSSLMLAPDDPVPPSGVATPVWHLHGHILAPESIVISEADYVSAIRPFKYRQTKLGTMLSESVTLFIGYAVGDINVQSAIDHSEVYGRRFRNPLVLAQWVQKDPKPDPYRGPHGVEVVEVSDVIGLLEEVAERVKAIRAKQEDAISHVRTLRDSSAARDVFITDATSRATTVKRMRVTSVLHGNREVLEALTAVFDAIWSSTIGKDGWPHYMSLVDVLMDCFVLGSPADSPGVFAFLYGRLHQIAYYINASPTFKMGTAYDATKLWHARWPNVTSEVRAEIRAHARAMGDLNVLQITGGV